MAASQSRSVLDYFAPLTATEQELTTLELTLNYFLLTNERDQYYRRTLHKNIPRFPEFYIAHKLVGYAVSRHTLQVDGIGAYIQLPRRS